MTERLGVGKPLVFDTVIPHCSHNILLDRPVLSIVHNILALACASMHYPQSRATLSHLCPRYWTV